MSFTIKLGHNGHTRRLTHPDPPTWEWLAAKVSELYKIPRDDVALSYVDAEEDQVTLSTQEELEDYFTNFHRRGETARFTVQNISTPPVTQVADEDDGARDVDPLEAEEWHKVDAESKSLDVFGLDGLWAGLGGLNPNYFSIVTTPSPSSRFQGPDLIIQQPVNLMSPSTATLIRMEGDISDAEGEAEKPTPRLEKSKGKEVGFDEHPTVTTNVPDAQSLRAAEADPAASGATIGKVETTMPPPAQPPVEDPPLPTFGTVPVTPVSAPAAGAPGPPDPTVASAGPPNTANTAQDVAALLQALTTAFVTNPELAEGVRKIIRLATDPTYFRRRTRPCRAYS
ncbi:hypothetical protein BS47DRAFT_190193 [Hydnum rufescens UP504]|uniref:PB1 domain-containing protein n=1 Tax=Hydnum rufescens UP504 TaxID=1448309 RepID=A0A9P6ANN5_9AGAM|nr:hypothetical protein BS47DRAFT_190193 [Hydnum rufescens UP504]